MQLLVQEMMKEAVAHRTQKRWVRIQICCRHPWGSNLRLGTLYNASNSQSKPRSVRIRRQCRHPSRSNLRLGALHNAPNTQSKPRSASEVVLSIMANEEIVEEITPSGVLVGIQFDLMTSQDMEKYSVISIVESSDVTSPKLGLPNMSAECTTCASSNVKECDGHFGVIKLPATIYHPYFVSELVQILNQICPGCKSIKQDLRKKGSRKGSAGKNAYQWEALYKHLLNILGEKSKVPPPVHGLASAIKSRDIFLTKCSKLTQEKAAEDAQETCKYCCRSGTERYPAVKFKISSENLQGKKILIVAEAIDNLPKKFQKNGLSEELPKDYWSFIPGFSNKQESNRKRISLSPSQVFEMLKQLDRGFVEQFVRRKEFLFLSSIPVTPNSHRVTENYRPYADGPQLSYDESTKACKRVVDVGRKIGDFRRHEQFRVLAPSYTASRVRDYLNATKLRSYRSSVEGRLCKSGMKWVKDVILTKRSDNAFRLVMIGDPKIRLCEIGVPREIAENMFIAEHVNAHNINKLSLSCNLLLLKKEELQAKSKGNLISVRKANELKIGDILYRPLRNGDMVLVNRPPSVHPHSLLALSVKILPTQSVISINPLCCAPILGDFDGDCIHGYIPQSVRCSIELRELVSLQNQLLNVQDGRSLLALTHDSLTAAHLLTVSEVFFDKYQMQQFEMLCPNRLPLPLAANSASLWTGHQLFDLLFPPSVNYDRPRKAPISKGEISSSTHGSFWLQNTKSGIFSAMFKCYGKKALDLLFSAQDVLCEYITMRGLSVSLADVYLAPDGFMRKKLIEQVSLGLQEAEYAFHTTQLMLDPMLEFLPESHDESKESLQYIRQYEQKRTYASPMSIAAFKGVFHDIQNTIPQYVHGENSILAMIHAGSKGNLLKLVQQSACLGLQMSASSLPFKFPCELSNATWNQRNASDVCRMPQEACEPTGSNAYYAVITSSFLDGLNPLECFVHALSGRANLFSENVEVPGVLQRKLMFYMRDLYLAYDGTVRSVYGQQLVQFNYDLCQEASIKVGESVDLAGEGSTNGSRLDGQPVGSLAACSITEAAYGAADQSVVNSEASPLMKLKEVLECRLATSAHKTITLFLSNNLERWYYGFEYGSLQVKNHLEKVILSDVVTTVTIVYDVLGVDATKFSPWISHFHLCKVRMIRKRINIQHIIKEVMGNYSSLRVRKDVSLPVLCITSKECCIADSKEEANETDCVTVSFETSEFDIQLDTIRDVFVPVLLQTVIKGFLEFTNVEILSDTKAENHGRPFLKVTSTKNYSPGKFWEDIQNACIPIMDLIDWESSHPDDIRDVFVAFGIDAAWRYFLGLLKTAISDTGRNIHREHLITVANSLSMTGEFHGLNFKGLKQQRIHASISSPVSHAFFSSPNSHFINAAKQGSIDNLRGSVDAVSWGKEAPTGTGGPFELIYSGEVRKQKKVDNIYKFLHSLKQDKPCQNQNGSSKPSQTVGGKWETDAVASTRGLDGQSIPNRNYMEASGSTNPVRRWEQPAEGRNLFNHISLQSKEGIGTNFALHNASTLSDIVNMHSSLSKILHGYKIDDCLNEADKSSVLEALTYHPKGDEKLGSGIKEIKVGRSPTYPGSRCFILIRADGTMEDMSYRKCVIGAAERISPKYGLMVRKKLDHRQ